MSFSDIGKRRMNREYNSEQSSSIHKFQAQKAAPPTLRHFYVSANDQPTLEPSQHVHENFARSTPRRGVRPHLSNVCPVTKEPLMEADSTRDEDNSTVTSFSYGFEDAEEDNFSPTPVTTSRSRQADSEYALLNQEIVNFQVRAFCI